VPAEPRLQQHTLAFALVASILLTKRQQQEALPKEAAAGGSSERASAGGDANSLDMLENFQETPRDVATSMNAKEPFHGADPIPIAAVPGRTGKRPIR